MDNRNFTLTAADSNTLAALLYSLQTPEDVNALHLAPNDKENVLTLWSKLYGADRILS